MRSPRLAPLLIVPALAAIGLTACSDDDAGGEDAGAPSVVVSTSVLGDVVENLTGGAVDVTVLVPAGADPHQFQLSARQAAEVSDADVLVVNGGGLEVGLVDVIAAAADDGVPVIEAIDGIAPLASHDHDDHDHDDHDHDDHGDHDHDGVDPHFFTDPGRMADAVGHIAHELTVALGETDVDVAASAAAYQDELDELAAEVDRLLEPIPVADRLLVTNHDVFAYFADAYDFRVVGTVIPSGSTSDGASAGALADLAALVEVEGVPAVFVDASSSVGLAETLADEVDGVEIVELYTESLGESGSDGATYVGMIRTNAQRIAAALG